MGLAQEIFEGIAAAKGVKEAFDYSEQNYRNEAYRAAKRENDIWEEYDRAGVTGEEEYRRSGRGPRGAPGVQTQAASGTPGTNTDAFAINTGWQPPPAYTGYTGGQGGWSHGSPFGRHLPRPRFQHGGMVLDERGLPYREAQPFDPEGDGYDYDQARAAGLGPDRDGHWPSREPGSGMMLKGRRHSTFDTGVEDDRRKGYGLEKQNGRYYTQPFKRQAMRRGGKPDAPVPNLGVLPVPPGEGEVYNDGQMTDRDIEWYEQGGGEGSMRLRHGPFPGQEVGPGERGMSYEDLMALHRKNPGQYGRPRWRTPLRPPKGPAGASVTPPLDITPAAVRTDAPPTRPSVHDEGAGSPRQSYPEMRQGDPMVRDDDHDSEAELVVKSLISRDVGDPNAPPPVTSGEVNRSIDSTISEQVGTPDAPPPVTDREVAPEGAIRRELGDFDKMSSGKPYPEHKAEMDEITNDPSYEYWSQGQKDRIAAAETERANAAELDREGQALVAGQPPAIPNERSSKVGRALKAEITQSPEAAAIQNVNGKINALVAERQRVDPGLFQQTTPDERAAAERRIREIDAELAELNKIKQQIAQPQPPTMREDPIAGVATAVQGGARPFNNMPPRETAPAKRGMPTPKLPPDTGPPMAGPMAALDLSAPPLPPSPAGDDGTMPPPPPKVVRPGAGNTRRPNQTPTQQGSQDGQSTNGNNTPGGAPGSQPAPPQTALNVGPPTGAPKLEDTQKRVEAFNPDADRLDPNTGRTQARGLDASGKPITRAYSEQDMGAVIQAGMSVMRPGPDGQPPVIGQHAVRPETADAFAAAHNQGGRLSKGEAYLAGMTAQFRVLMRRGKVREASMLAAGILQAANVEAAAYGQSAQQLYGRGNYDAAGRKFVDGMNMYPDGVQHEWNNGVITSRDPYTGQVLGSGPVTPQQLLAGIMGLQDGSAFYKALQGAANMFAKPDKDAEGRMLANEIRRRNIALLDKKLAGNTGTATGNSYLTGINQRIAALGGTPPPTQQGGGSAPPQGDGTVGLDNTLNDTGTFGGDRDNP